MRFDDDVRYSVDPATLQTAAGHADHASQAATRARDQLLRAGADLTAWCPVEIRRYVDQACDALATAALAAHESSTRTATRLMHAAEDYRRADRQLPQ